MFFENGSYFSCMSAEAASDLRVILQQRKTVYIKLNSIGLSPDHSNIYFILLMPTNIYGALRRLSSL